MVRGWIREMVVTVALGVSHPESTLGGVRWGLLLRIAHVSPSGGGEGPGLTKKADDNEDDVVVAIL